MKKLLIAVTIICFSMGMLTIAVAAETKKGMVLPADWETYRHIGSLIVTDKTNSLQGIHHFYMNKIGIAAFKKGEKYPDGSVIVDAVYEIKYSNGIINEGKRVFFPVMRKNSKMTETGGWEWYAFSADGKMLDKDPKKDCLFCHESAKDSDYVLSKPLK
jgi:Cytochrome P460